METFYEVREFDALECMAEIGALIRFAFADVAEEFHLTPQNCQYHPAFLSDDDLADSLLRPGVTCFGAFLGDALVGFAAIWPKTEDAFAWEPEITDYPGTFELTRLCVLPAHRRAGLGARLLRAALLAAQTQGARKIEIGIIAENTRLKRWYERQGFHAAAVKEYAHLPFTVCEMEREV